MIQRVIRASAPDESATARANRNEKKKRDPVKDSVPEKESGVTSAAKCRAGTVGRQLSCACDRFRTVPLKLTCHLGPQQWPGFY